MGQIEFINPNKHQVSLLGPDKKSITLRSAQKIVLPDFFMRYVPRYLKVLKVVDGNVASKAIFITNKPKMSKKDYRSPPQQHKVIIHRKPVLPNIVRIATKMAIVAGQRRVVGRVSLQNEAASHYYRQVIDKNVFPISNDIGIGILSYNRLHSLQRLVDSVRRCTDLSKTTVFISDESTDQAVKDYLSKITDMIVINNTERLGIAGNTNRLLRCLKRFRHKILLNDDVEILRSGWDSFYFDAMAATGYHHFCMRQPGICGATGADGQLKIVNNYHIRTIDNKPHGAIMAFDTIAFDKVGYFDESFGIYGMEHVDWSERVSNSGIQPSGYHDLINSIDFIKIHAENSVVENKSVHLSNSRNILDEKRKQNRIYVEPTPRSIVDAVTYIIPFRNINRGDAITTVVRNIKAQRFPEIEIVLVEQDDETRLRSNVFDSIKYALVPGSKSGQPFTKAIAFNKGVSIASFRKIILQDADMLVKANYTETIAELLRHHDAVHVGKNVLYLTQESSTNTIQSGKLEKEYHVERTVGYFEGGSVGITINSYMQIGGFNEDFIGYGNEDTEFYGRLAGGGIKFHSVRTEDLIHLWHARTDKWVEYHRINKVIEAEAVKRPIGDRLSHLRSVLSKYNIDVNRYR